MPLLCYYFVSLRYGFCLRSYASSVLLACLPMRYYMPCRLFYYTMLTLWCCCRHTTPLLIFSRSLLLMIYHNAASTLLICCRLRLRCFFWCRGVWYAAPPCLPPLAIFTDELFHEAPDMLYVERLMMSILLRLMFAAYTTPVAIIMPLFDICFFMARCCYFRLICFDLLPFMRLLLDFAYYAADDAMRHSALCRVAIDAAVAMPTRSCSFFPPADIIVIAAMLLYAHDTIEHWCYAYFITSLYAHAVALLFIFFFFPCVCCQRALRRRPRVDMALCCFTRQQSYAASYLLSLIFAAEARCLLPSRVTMSVLSFCSHSLRYILVACLMHRAPRVRYWERLIRLRTHAARYMRMLRTFYTYAPHIYALLLDSAALRHASSASAKMARHLMIYKMPRRHLPDMRIRDADACLFHSHFRLRYVMPLRLPARYYSLFRYIIAHRHYVITYYCCYSMPSSFYYYLRCPPFMLTPACLLAFRQHAFLSDSSRHFAITLFFAIFFIPPFRHCLRVALCADMLLSRAYADVADDAPLREML